MEPRQYHSQELIHDEDEGLNEITMLETGYVDIGYTIGKKKIYKLRIKEPYAIGMYNVTFNRNTSYICKAATRCEGYFIRR